jgi:pimeloyl-ACP methyl ester carboxylesterase
MQIANGELRLVAQRSPAPGDGVLLLHGLAGHSGEWTRVVQRMSACDAIALDLRGHRRSERFASDLSPEAFCSDVIAVIAATGHEQVHLVGQSFGGHIAFLVASWHPESVASLTVIEADPHKAEPEVEEGVARWLRSWGRPFADRRAALAFFGDDQTADVWVEGLEERADGLWPRFDGDVLLKALHGLAHRSWWEDWRRIRCPTLVVRGDQGDLQVDMANKMAGEVVPLSV